MPLSLKQQVAAAEHRHRMRMLGLSNERWAADRRGLIEGSRRLMQQEIDALLRAHNDNAQRVLSKVAGRETTYDPTTGTSPSKSQEK